MELLVALSLHIFFRVFPFGAFPNTDLTCFLLDCLQAL